MKVKKNGIEIVIDEIDLPKYIRAGWVKKLEVHPDAIKRHNETQQRKKGKVKQDDN